MKGAIGAALVLAAGAVLFKASAQVPDDNKSDNLQTPQIKAYCATADKLLAKLKKVYGEVGLNFTGPDKLTPYWAKYSPDDSWSFLTMVGPTVRIDSDDYTFIFRTTDNALTACSCSSSYQLYKGRPFDLQSKSADWKEARAIQIATTVRDVFVDLNAAKLSKPSVQHVDSPNDPEKWKITWQRLDNEGHEFEGDSVFVGIDQVLGFGQIQIKLTTPYAEATGKKIEELVAVAKAEDAIRAGTFPEANYSRKAELKVVLPPKVISSDWSSPSTGQCRLAWVLLFNPVNPAQLGSTDSNAAFEIWVDAITGQILGPRMGAG